MKADETHIYSIKLAAGQFLHIVVEQRGIDVVVALFGPDGKQVFALNSSNGEQGTEPVLAIAKRVGNYRVGVRALWEMVRQ